MVTVELLIRDLGLEPHPEGGFYGETYRSAETCNSGMQGAESRSLCTSIYYLLKSGQVSVFHSLKSDELWHYHAGSSLILHQFDREGKYQASVLGVEGGKDRQPQRIMRAGIVFGAEVMDPGSFSLVGCVVCPGFDFRDFTLHSRNELLKRFPEQHRVIQRLTNPQSHNE